MHAPRPGFVTGTKSLFGGIGWLFSTPRAWPFAAVPFLLLLVLGGALATIVVYLVPDLVGRTFGPSDSALGNIGVGVVKVLLTAAALVVSSLIAFALAQPLSGPALERIVRLQEEALGAPVRAQTSFVTDVVRSLKSLLIGYAFGVPATVLLLILGLVLPFASVVTVPLKLLVAALTIAWDLCDYPLSVRGMRVRDRLRTLGRYKAAVLGFSAGLALAALVPCMLFIVLPAGVAGATRLLFAIEEHERAPRKA